MQRTATQQDQIDTDLTVDIHRQEPTYMLDLIGLGLALRPTDGGLGLDSFGALDLISYNASIVNYHEFSLLLNLMNLI